jgi:hypothetical protein
VIAPRLEILRLGPIEEEAELLPWLATALQRRLGFGQVVQTALEHPDWLEDGDGRLSSNRLVDALVDRGDIEEVRPDERWTLAITASDLHAPGRDFVFGEATLGGGWAVVGLARLALGAAPELLRVRLLKESLHELGHLAGLTHCSHDGCVMTPATDLAGVDHRSFEFCSSCRDRLEDA